MDIIEGEEEERDGDTDPIIDCNQEEDTEM